MFDACEGTVVGTAEFDVVPADGRFGACQFETIAAAQGDGTSADGLRAAVSAFILRRPDARVQYGAQLISCLLYTSPSPRDRQKSRMPSSA